MTTQHLTNARRIDTEALSVTPGEPVIQYGNFRIDRPCHRGVVLIRIIPFAEQRRLTAALKEARRIREAEAAAQLAGASHA